MDGITITEDHVYTLPSGQHPVSVTQVLSGVGIIDSTWFTAHAALRGTYVHKACELYDLGKLDLNTVDTIIEPYVSAYIQFRHDTGFVPELIEASGYNSMYDYAGTLDRAGKMNGANTLIDLKSGSLPKWVRWQTAAYQHLDCVPLEFKGCIRYGLQLRQEGTYRLTEGMTGRNDWAEFVSMLTTYRCLKSVGQVTTQKGTDNERK
jgi:hypothetical protein